MLRLYYRVKPLIPRRLQILLRRYRSLRIMRRTGGRLLNEEWLRTSAFPWPQPWRGAVMLTHDVELAGGQSNIPRLLEIENRRGLKSCWNFVVQRYPVDERLIARLREEGHEIGVHGVKHDGRLFESEALFRHRLAIMVDAAARWGAVGFRSPSLLYDLSMMGDLPFAWDSSLPAWDPFLTRPAACGRYAPFLLHPRCVELPVTLWQDIVLLDELRVDALAVWRQQATAILAGGGLVNVIVHPDYMTDGTRLALYDGLLGFLQELPGAWIALPRQVAAWALARLSLQDEAPSRSASTLR